MIVISNASHYERITMLPCDSNERIIITVRISDNYIRVCNNDLGRNKVAGSVADEGLNLSTFQSGTKKVSSYIYTVADGNIETRVTECL